MTVLSLLFDILWMSENGNEWFQHRSFNKAEHGVTKHSCQVLDEKCCVLPW